MREEQWAGLKVRIVGGIDGQGGGTGPLIVLMHGFGAPGSDLVPLAQVLSLPKEYRFVFPAAPLEMDFGFWRGAGVVDDRHHALSNGRSAG